MNRILLPFLALGLVALAFFSFIAVSLIGLAGVLAFSLVRGISRFTARISGQPDDIRRGHCGQAQNQASMGSGGDSGTINRVWNDGRGTIIDM